MKDEMFLKNEMFLKDKAILITGGNGFIGTNLGLYLRDEKGAKILNVDKKKNSPVGLNTKIIDLSDFDELKRVIDSVEIDYVIHLAGFSSPAKCLDEQLTIRENVSVIENLLNVIEGKDVRGIVFSSTSFVYDFGVPMPIAEESKLNPDNHIYARTKIIGERLFQKFSKETGIPCAILRISNAYGPYQDWKNNPTLIPQVVSQALIKGKIEVKDMAPVRDWIYVDDVVRAFSLALENESSGVFNVSSGVGISVGEIVKHISKRTGAEVCYESDEPGFSGNVVILDNNKLKSVLGWKPLFGLEDGLNKTIEYYQKTLKDRI